MTALSKRCQKMSKKHFDNNFDSLFDREPVRRPRPLVGLTAERTSSSHDDSDSRAAVNH